MSMDQLEMYMEGGGGGGADGLPSLPSGPQLPIPPTPAPHHPVPSVFNPVAHGLDPNFRLTRFAELKG